MGLHCWFMGHKPEEKFIYSDAAAGQIMFVRDKLIPGALWGVPNHPYMAKDYDRYERLDCCKVISTHRSKSVELPVYEVDFMTGIVLTFRGNFHDWKVSVDANYPIKLHPMGVFTPSTRYSACYFEGFPESKIFGSYEDDQQRFSVEVLNREALWFVFREIANSVIAGNPLASLAAQAEEYDR